MEIGVVVHGPGIVDSGWAKKIIDILSNFGNVRCRLGGTMGRTAVIDAGLEDLIDISLKLLPSQSLELFNREHVDVIFLLNYGKSAETGQVFGYKVFNHYFKQISNEDYLATNHKSLYESSIPVIQIERPGEVDGSIISWNATLNEQLAKSKKSTMAKLGFGKKNMVESLSFNFEELFDGLRASLELIEVKPEDVIATYLANNQEKNDEESIERLLRSYEDYETSNYTYRKIHGVSPDENIFINGIVVGYSNADSIVLVARDGFIVDIINGTIKHHGLEKLGPVDLERVIVKTGLLRKSDDVNPRILSHDEISVNDTERYLYSGEISDDDYSFKIAYVDHAAYDIYKFKDFDLVVTIGDDTSLVASDILYRFNIPIIGITDGDLDKVVENGFVNEKSTIVEVSSGFDDIVGHYIFEELFLSKDTLEIPFDEEAKSVEEFKSVMFRVFKSHVLEKVKDIVPSFIEKDHNYEVISTYHEVVDENPELVENLDEFIDGFEYEDYEESEEVYLDDAYDSPVEEIYVEHDTDEELIYEDISDEQLEEMIVEHASEAPSDNPLRDIIVEHGVEGLSDEQLEEIFVDSEDDEEIIYDDVPVEEVYLDEEDSIIYDDAYVGEEEYLDNISDEIYYDEVPIEDSAVDSPVEEIYVEYDDETIYDDVEVEEVFIEDEAEEVPVESEDGVDEIVPIEAEENADELIVESENTIEETVYIGSEEDIDSAEGWAEYLEEEFGDSLDESNESSESEDKQN